jgi:hypothetical protein
MSDYELVGHRFYAYEGSMSLVHRLTFSISLPLSTGKKWIAYYYWKEGGSEPEDLKKMIVATGREFAPLPYRSSEVFPKDIIKKEPFSILRYIRYKDASGVLLHLNVQGVSPPLEFRMKEPARSQADEAFTYKGITVLFSGGKKEQVLSESGVWGEAPAEEWR